MENSITLPKLIFSKNFINELKNLNLKKKFVLFFKKKKIYFYVVLKRKFLFMI